MHVVYASNDEYVPFLGISLLSLLVNNNELTVLSIYVLSDDISDKNQETLSKLVKRYGRNLEFIDLLKMNELIPFEFDTSGFHPIVLSRLFLGDLLEDSINRVLYLDCDTIVEGSLRELETIYMEKEYVAMVPELYMPEEKKKLVDLCPQDIYYNAGIILFNLDLIRRDDMKTRFLNYYKRKNGKLLYNDQDIINHCCKNHIKRLSHKYNLSPNLRYFPRYFIKQIQPSYYLESRKQYKEILKNPIIIHFMGDERPWIRGNYNSYRKNFIKYKKQSPWKEMKMISGQEWYMMCYHILNLITEFCPWFRIAFSKLIGINKYDWFGKK